MSQLTVTKLSSAILEADLPQIVSQSLKSLLHKCLRAHVAVELMYKEQGRSLAPRLKTALFLQAAFGTESLLATWKALGTRSEGFNVV